jgi:hypothetical protein
MLIDCERHCFIHAPTTSLADLSVKTERRAGTKSPNSPKKRKDKSDNQERKNTAKIHAILYARDIGKKIVVNLK